jgi:hypothetical protein
VLPPHEAGSLNDLATLSSDDEISPSFSQKFGGFINDSVLFFRHTGWQTSGRAGSDSCFMHDSITTITASSPLYGAFLHPGGKQQHIHGVFLILATDGKKALGTSGQYWLADSRFLVLVILMNQCFAKRWIYPIPF